jgi:CHAT domain-containing protein/Tfp pilus assembly protein PilF
MLACCGCASPPSPNSRYQQIVRDSQRGDLQQAVKQADREYRHYAQKEPDQAWRFRVLEAQLLVMQGRMKSALILVQDPLPRSLSNNDVAVRREMVLGLALGFSHQFDQSMRELGGAEQLAGSGHPDLLAQILLSKGSVYVEEAHYADAETQFRRALEIARAGNFVSLQSRILGSLGNAAMWQEHYDEAVDWYNSSLDLSRRAGARDVSAITLGNIGWSYFALGDFDNALLYFTRAETASAKTGLSRGEVQWMINEGNVQYEQGAYALAAETYQKALQRARQQQFDSATAECLDDLAQVAVQEGRVDSAARFSADAMQLVRGRPDHFLQPYSELIEGQVEQAARDYGAARELFNSVMDDPSAGTSLDWEAEVRLGQVYASEGNRQSANEQFRDALRSVEKARSAIKEEEFRLSFLSNATAAYDSYVDLLIDENKTIEALQVADLSRAQTLADGLGFPSRLIAFPIRRFQPTLTAQRLRATILSYWLGARRSYLWVITSRKTSIFRLPPSAQIDALVQSYRQALLGPRDVLETGDRSGRELYNLLIGPAAAQVPKGSHVVVIPDGSLSRLNFETLVAGRRKPHYWIEDVTVSEAPSLILLAASTRRVSAHPKKGLLLIGDPIPSNSQFPRLRQAKSEMTQIERFFPRSGRVVLSGASANPEGYLKSHPGEFAFLHFTAHGIASRLHPLDSAVILSRMGDSYKLYAREVMKEPLHAELVTISACNSAGDRTYWGEGLVGLAWAFLHAGAHEVVSTLWEVDDNSTALLMNSLYSELSRGVPPETALRDAKLSLLHSGSVYEKPFYWAAFEIYRGL